LKLWTDRQTERQTDMLTDDKGRYKARKPITSVYSNRVLHSHWQRSNAKENQVLFDQLMVMTVLPVIKLMELTGAN